MTEPTPRPWQWDCGDIGAETPRPYLCIHVDAGDITIADVNYHIPEGRANACLIVTAVNCHDELSNFADDFKTWWEQAGQHFYSDDDGLISLAEDANAILTKVRAQSEPGE